MSHLAINTSQLFVIGSRYRVNAVRGWELLAICCGLFLPSRNLGPYLVDYILRHTKQNAADGYEEEVPPRSS